MSSPQTQPKPKTSKKARTKAQTDERSDMTTAHYKTPSEAINSALTSHFSPTGVVTLIAGGDQQNMIAQAPQLTRDSEYFEAAMKKEWAEGQTRTIKLPEESPATMAHYLAYSYGGKLFTEDIRTGSLGENDSQIESCFQMLVSLYVCGERFLNRRIQQSVVREILRITLHPGEDNCYWYPSREEVNIMYRGTPEGSPGRRLMVDLQIFVGAKEELDYDLEAAFLVDLAKAFHDKLECEAARKQLPRAKPKAEDYL